MKRNRLLLILAIVIVATLVLAGCKCTHEQYTDWEITKDPTMTATGTATRKCVKCNEPETKDIPALSDTAVWTKSDSESVAPEHGKAGKDVYTSEYGKVTVNLDPIDHTFDKSVVDAKYLKQAATCTTRAVYYKSCECGQASETLTFEDGEILGHNATHHPAVAPNCTTDGTKEHWTCSREEGKYFTSEECDTEVENGIVVPALNHEIASGTLTIVTEPTLDAVGSATFTCARENCPITDKAVTLELAKLSDTTVWTVVTTPADYEHPETTTYTHKIYTAVVITKTSGSALALPYAGKKYNSVTVDNTGVNTRVGVVTLDANGNGTGTGYPLNGANSVSGYNPKTGSITYTVGSTEYKGFVESHTGIICMSNNDFETVYILTPYGTVGANDCKALKLNDTTKGIQFTYKVNETAQAQTMNIFTSSKTALFEAEFVDENGSDVTLEHSFAPTEGSSDKLDNHEKFIVMQEGAIVAGFEKSGKITFAQYNIYSGDVELSVYDNGRFVLGTKSGTYTVNQDKTLDAFVIADGKKVEHYTITLSDDGTYTLTDVKVEITFVVGENGTLTEAVQSLYVGCVLTVVPTVTNPETITFVGWYSVPDADITEDDAITVVPVAAMTLYAQYSSVVTYHVVDVLGGNKDITVAEGLAILPQLPNYNSETYNIADNTVFAGWQYETASGQTGMLPSDQVAGASDDGMTLTSVWNDAGRWTTFITVSGWAADNSQFTYNADTKEWKVMNYGNAVRYSIISAVGGDITVSFKYYIKGNSSQDTLQIYKNSTSIVSLFNGQTSGASEPKEFKLSLKAGEVIQFQAKYNSLNNENYGIFLKDLTINGRAITTVGEYDKLEGTYTCEGNDDLVLDGYGSFVWGELVGTYTVDATDRNKLTAKVLDGSTVVGQYTVTLDGTTYTAETSKVNVTYHYGIVGTADDEALGTKTTEAVEIYSTVTLPTPTVPDGYIFLGWYKGTWANAAKYEGTINPDVDTDVYARFAQKVTVTYHHNVDGVEDMLVDSEKGKAIGDLLYKMPDSITVSGQQFAGWFTLDGTTTGEWGSEVTSTTTVSADMEVYAKWVTPHPLAGTYKGYEVYKENNATANKSIVIDTLGNATGNKTGAVEYDAETGWGKIGNRLMYVDASKNALVVSDGSETVFVGGWGHDAHFLFKAETVTLNNNDIITWNNNKSRVAKFVVDGRDIWVYADENDIAFNVEVSITDASGNAVTSSYKTYGNVVSIDVREGLTVTKVYNGSAWVELDGYQGDYTDGTIGNFSIDGIKKVIVGEKQYDYTVIAEGTISVIVEGQYYEISNLPSTCSVTAFNANVTYSIEHGSIGDDVTLTPSVNVEITLPMPTVDDGWGFFGWFTNADFTGAKVEKVTFAKNDNKTYYAKVIETPDWSAKETAPTAEFDANGKATISGSTTTDFKTYYVKFVVSETGVYYFKGSTSIAAGGSGSSSIKFSVLNSEGAAIDNFKAVSYNSTYNGPVVLDAGTYYFQTAFGGQVVGSTTDNNKWGTFNLTIQRKDLVYTLGEEETSPVTTVTVNNASSGSELSASIQLVYRVDLVAGLDYTINFSAVAERAQLPIRTKVNVPNNSNIVTTGWVDQGKTATKTFSVSESGTYYILNAGGNIFSITVNAEVEKTIFAGKTYNGTKQAGYNIETRYSVIFDSTGTAGKISTAVYAYDQPTLDSHSYDFTSVVIDETAKTVTLTYSGAKIVATYTETTIIFPSSCAISDLSGVTVTTSDPIVEGTEPVGSNPFAGKTLSYTNDTSDMAGYYRHCYDVVFTSATEGYIKTYKYDIEWNMGNEEEKIINFTCVMDNGTITFKFADGKDDIVAEYSNNTIKFPKGCSVSKMSGITVTLVA